MMAKSRAKPWKSKWKELQPLGKGGQGTTSLVAADDDSEIQTTYALKRLNDQTDAERRSRMYREVAALRPLDHPRVPKVIDTNAEAFADLTQDLFLVTTFIPGSTLEAYVDRPSSISLEEATRLAITLAEILIYCHSHGVIHRDIKPDNIVLRNDSTDDPVLLDFGLSFNQETDAGDGLTRSAQQLGNRFLALPELQLKSANKRDHRSDLTQLCGIFLYTLTSEHPVTLIDDQLRLPHQRPRAAAFLASLSPEIRTRLNRLFDVGFAGHIDHRFQSAQALREDLLSLTRTSDAQQGGSVEEMLNSIRERLAAQQKSIKQQYHDLLKHADNCIRQAQNKVKNELGDDIHTLQGGYVMSLPTLTLRNHLGLYLALDEEHKFFPEFLTVITGSELVVTGRHKGVETELFRTPTAGPHEWKPLVASTKVYFTEGLHKAIT